jgi:hypothetical protein
MVLLNWWEIINRLVDWHPLPSNKTTDQYNLSLAASGVGQKLASSPVAVNLSSNHLVCVLDPRDQVLLAAVCAEWPYEEGSRTMGCDDALEVEKFVVVGDYIDDMSDCQ